MGFEPPTLLFSFPVPVDLCFFYLWKEIFHEGKAVYGKHVGIFPYLLFCSIQVNIPMHAGEFVYVFILFHTKLIFSCMQGDLNKSYIRNIFVGYK